MATPDPRIEYAPTARGSCKRCGVGIAKGDLRIQQYKRSGFHDGFVRGAQCPVDFGDSSDIRSHRALSVTPLRAVMNNNHHDPH